MELTYPSKEIGTSRGGCDLIIVTCCCDKVIRAHARCSDGDCYVVGDGTHSDAPLSDGSDNDI